MFTQESSTVEGTHHRVADVMNNPSPIRGDIPIMIGGSGEKKTLRMVAQYADASNFFGDPERLRHLVGVLEGHCERLGPRPRGDHQDAPRHDRDRSTHERAEAKLDFLRRIGISDERISRVDDRATPTRWSSKPTEMLDAGLDGLIFNVPDAHDTDAVALVGETLAPLLAERRSVAVE